MEDKNNMTVAQMQKLLDEEALEGKTEYEALKKLARILGIQFTPADTADKKEGTHPGATNDE